jgi:hypothetical protein
MSPNLVISVVTIKKIICKMNNFFTLQVWLCSVVRNGVKICIFAKKEKKS